MALTIAQANAVNHIIHRLTGGGIGREQAIADLALLAEGARKALTAGRTAGQAEKMLRERWPNLAAETWTDTTDGRVYDLTISYRDAAGDAWTPIGWLTPFDGVPTPYMECNGHALDIETVVREFGPLTADDEAVSA